MANVQLPIKFLYCHSRKGLPVNYRDLVKVVHILGDRYRPDMEDSDHAASDLCCYGLIPGLLLNILVCERWTNLNDLRSVSDQ